MLEHGLSVCSVTLSHTHKNWQTTWRDKPYSEWPSSHWEVIRLLFYHMAGPDLCRCLWGTHLFDVLCPASALLSLFSKWHGLRPVWLEWVEIQKMPRWHRFVMMPVATAFSSTPTAVAQGASSVVNLSTFWPVHQKLWCGKEKNGTQRFRTTVYSALAQAQRSCLQRLSALALFWVSFIYHKLPTQTAQIPPLPR